MSLKKDSLANTFIVATVLCLVCAALVSTAAVGLKPIKNRNILLDRKNNILAVAGFTPQQIKDAGGVDQLFKKSFEAIIVDLDTGELAAEECKAAIEKAKETKIDDIVQEYDQFWASKRDNPALSKELTKAEDLPGIKRRENYSHVYMLKSGDKVEKYVFPVRGNGLWSLMRGYLALEPDLQTVAGITFYEQAETPGLGGEVQNPNWKAKWPGKLVYEDGKVALDVEKGDQSGDEYAVDALSGATITSNGVSKMIEFWMGPQGFKPFIDKQKPGVTPVSKTSNAGGTNGQ